MNTNQPTVTITLTLNEFIVLFSMLHNLNMKFIQLEHDGFLPDDYPVFGGDYGTFRRVVEKLQSLNLQQARQSEEAV